MSKSTKKTTARPSGAKTAQKRTVSPVIRELLPVILAIPLAFALLYFTTRHYRLPALAACVFSVILLWKKRDALRERCSLAALLLIGYVALAGLSGAWAVHRMLFFEEYSKLLVSLAVFLAVLLLPRDRQNAVRVTLRALASAAAGCALLSVEAASTGLTRTLTWRFLDAPGLNMSFEAGTRLTGIFCAPNVLAGILAIGILAALALLGMAQTKRERAVCSGLLSVSAFGFLLTFSMGGSAFFALAVVVWLSLAGRERLRTLVSMLTAAVPTAVFAFIAFRFFNQPGFAIAVPLLLLAANCAAVVLLDSLTSRFPLKAELKRGTVVVVLCAAVVAVAGYVLAGVSVTGGYTFGETLRRSVYLGPGETQLSTQANGDVGVTVTSQNRLDTMMHTDTVLYDGQADGASFTVPEDSIVCYLTFYAEPGVTLDSAFAGGTAVKLDYKLLPAFISNRLQGLRANENAIQRLVFFSDGMELFRSRPLFGGGLGSFEARFQSVQDFYYVTRYAHNHYIQILADNGLFGLVLYAAAMLLLLLRALKRRAGGDVTISPMLIAALVLICGHAAMEVTMSFAAYLPVSFAVFGLICLEGNTVKAGDSPRWATLALCGAYAILSLGSIAGDVLNGEYYTYREACGCLKAAAILDPFNSTYHKQRYIVYAIESGNGKYIGQAGVYADAISERRHFGCECAAVKYYIFNGQYDKALSTALSEIAEAPMNEDFWRNELEVFMEFYDGTLTDRSGGNPFESDRAQELVDAVSGICAALDGHNASAIQPIVLTDELEAFLSSLGV